MKPGVRRRLSIRVWFAAAGILVFIGTVLIGITLVVAFEDAREPWVVAEDAAEVLRDSADRWRDPAWQAAVTGELAEDGVDFSLFAGDVEIYRSGGEFAAAPGEAIDGDEQSGVFHVVNVDGVAERLTAYVVAPVAEDSVAEALAWVGGVLLVTSAVTAWLLGRLVVGPLRAASRAARQVAEGELDVSLPRSRVTEVDDVNAALETMAAELQRSLEQQAAIEQERRLFIAAIAHDLRTPLFSLRGYLDGLRDGVAETPEQRARYLHVATDKADALEHLVGNLFDYTRFAYLEQEPERHPLDLTVLLRQVVEGCQPAADAAGVGLTFTPPPVACAVEADRVLLERAIGNLLDNALRYTPAGGAIEVRCGLEEAQAWFAVEDTGPGIAAGDLPHLFDPLYRGEASRSRETGGAGLGLTIAQRILIAHGGDLRAENRREGGARFVGRIAA